MTTEGVFQNIENSFGEAIVLELYIQMYNYLYGGYRDMLYTDEYASKFNNVDLTSITESLINKYQQFNSEEEIKAEYDKIVAKLTADNANYDFNTIYTREYIDNLASSFNTY